MQSISTKDPAQRSSLAAAEERDASSLRHHVLHILDHSHPLLSGYSVRSHSLIKAQKKIGLTAEAVTGPLHQMEDSGAIDATIDEVSYWRTHVRSSVAQYVLERRVPILREMAVMRLLRERILEVLDAQPFDVVHAHSP